MTATKKTTLAVSFVVILTVITTMARKDDNIQERSVITELLNHFTLSRTSHGSLHVHTLRVCWFCQIVLGFARCTLGSDKHGRVVTTKQSRLAK